MCWIIFCFDIRLVDWNWCMNHTVWWVKLTHKRSMFSNFETKIRNWLAAPLTLNFRVWRGILTNTHKSDRKNDTKEILVCVSRSNWSIYRSESFAVFWCFKENIFAKPFLKISAPRSRDTRQMTRYYDKYMNLHAWYCTISWVIEV